MVFKSSRICNVFNNLFNQSPSIAPDKVKELFQNKEMDKYCLLDVRQPMEHSQGRLPGSVLIPLNELNIRVSELDPEVPTIVYCRTGARSASATNFLLGNGFDTVLNMVGGIVQYNGLIASGSPESSGVCFSSMKDALELAAMAWILEDGNIKFIEGLCHEVLNDHEPALFDKILEAKKSHCESLRQVAQDLNGGSLDDNFPQGLIEVPDEPTMVGCVKVSEALAWAKNKAMNDLLEVMMTLSANAYDFYLTLSRTSEGEDEKKIYTLLATEEHSHLDRLTEAFEMDIRYR
jgi:rhodanese-related sulfurtransferase